MERRRVVLPLALTILVALTSSAWADSNIRIVRLSYVQGSVLIDQGNGSGFKRAVMNMPVSSSTRIRTGDTGLAEVEFEEGATLRLVGDTTVLFQPLLLTSKGMRVSGIAVGEGTVYINVQNTKHDRFFLNVHGTPLEISRKTHLRISSDQKQIIIAIFKGEMMDTSSGVAIRSGQSLRIDQQTNSVTDVAKGIDPFATDAWDRERDRYHQNPTLYPSLATTSFVMGPTVASIDPCFGMAPGAFGVFVPGCGYWDQGYYGYWNPYPYAPYTPTPKPTTGTRPKPKPPEPHGHPMDVVGFPRTTVTLPTVASYTNMSRPDRNGLAMGIAPRPGSSPTEAFVGSRPTMQPPPPASTGAHWMPITAVARPDRPTGVGYNGPTATSRGGYSGEYSGSYSGSSSSWSAPSRPSTSYTPPPAAPSAPAAAPSAPAPSPVAIGRPGR